MSQPRERQACCCCPARVDVKGTYKTIGSDTVDNFKAHARSTITANIDRACNKCYKKYTRSGKSKVWQKAAQLPTLVSCVLRANEHNPRISLWATLCHSRKTHIIQICQLHTLAAVVTNVQNNQEMKQKQPDEVCDYVMLGVSCVMIVWLNVT